MTHEDLPRAAQLTQKTNQFNLTTRRYAEQDLQGFRRSAELLAVYIASVSDKFGDNGKTFLAILKKATPDTAEVDKFLMSCRVMGRFIEDQILDHLVRELRQQNVAKLRSSNFFPTKKNMPARATLDRLKGKIVSGRERQHHVGVRSPSGLAGDAAGVRGAHATLAGSIAGTSKHRRLTLANRCAVFRSTGVKGCLDAFLEARRRNYL